MHVHRPSVDLGIADLYAAQAAKKAEEARKAAEVRRKLLRASASIDGEFSEFVDLSVSERSRGGSRHGNNDGAEQGQGQNSTSHPARSARPDSSAARAVSEPLSIWA